MEDDECTHRQVTQGKQTERVSIPGAGCTNGVCRCMERQGYVYAGGMCREKGTTYKHTFSAS